MSAKKKCTQIIYLLCTQIYISLLHEKFCVANRNFREHVLPSLNTRKNYTS